MERDLLFAGPNISLAGRQLSRGQCLPSLKQVLCWIAAILDSHLVILSSEPKSKQVIISCKMPLSHQCLSYCLLQCETLRATVNSADPKRVIRICFQTWQGMLSDNVQSMAEIWHFRLTRLACSHSVLQRISLSWEVFLLNFILLLQLALDFKRAAMSHLKGLASLRSLKGMAEHIQKHGPLPVHPESDKTYTVELLDLSFRQ